MFKLSSSHLLWLLSNLSFSPQILDRKKGDCRVLISTVFYLIGFCNAMLIIIGENSLKPFFINLSKWLLFACTFANGTEGNM